MEIESPDSQDNVARKAAALPPMAVSNPQRKETTSALIAEGFSSRTEGERKFNHEAYIGVGYFGVTALSIALTWLMRDFEPISKHFNNGVNKLAEKITRKSYKEISKEVLGKFDSIASIATLFTGGTIMSVLPVKWMEDNKAEIVKKYDTEIYGAERVANDPYLVEAHKRLEEAPKQTWLSVGMSRLTSFVATFGTWYLIGTNSSPGAKATGWSIDKFGIKTARALDETLHAGANKPYIATMRTAASDKLLREGDDLLKPLSAEYKNGERIATRVWNYVVQDGLYTIITSASLFAFTRVFGPLFDKPHHTSAVANDNPSPSAKDHPPVLTHPSELTAPKALQAAKPDSKVQNVTHAQTVAATDALQVGSGA